MHALHTCLTEWYVLKNYCRYSELYFECKFCALLIEQCYIVSCDQGTGDCSLDYGLDCRHCQSYMGKFTTDAEGNISQEYCM